MREKHSAKKKNLLPRIEKNVARFLNSEEARISTKNLIRGSLTLFFLGVATEQTALATHSSHASYGSVHDSWGGHGNTSTHANGDAGHTSLTPHHSAAPHSSDNTLGVAHVSGHANGGVNELVTKGAMHNDATAGVGKHTAGTGHYNTVVVNNHVNTDGSGHADTAPHYSATPVHNSVGHSLNVANHNSYGQHYSLHANGADGHTSHASHGQW